MAYYQYGQAGPGMGPPYGPGMGPPYGPAYGPAYGPGMGPPHGPGMGAPYGPGMGGGAPYGPGPPYSAASPYGAPSPYGGGVEPSHNSSNNGDPQARGTNSKFFQETATTFSDASIRRGFIRKVYSILSLQLLMTAGVIAAFLFVEPVKEYVQENLWIRILAPLVFICSFIFIFCCGECRRQSPQNFICLSVFTLSMAFLTAIITSQYSSMAVLLAVLITAVVTIALTIFAIQTKIDFTLCAGLLFVGVIVLVVLGIVFAIAQMVFGYNKYLVMISSGLGALLFSAFLVYDTQMIVGGRREELSEEEYIFAAATLYIDIVYLFCDILHLVGGNM